MIGVYEERPYFERLRLLTGSKTLIALQNCRVIVVGIGGVGSWCAEALVRSGIGAITLVDHDLVCASNINRQIQALSSNIGRQKTQVLEERLREINPSCVIRSFPVAFSKENANLFDMDQADFVIDAIDILADKLDLIETALAAGKGFFSSMGMAQKLNPTLIRTGDIWESSGCPLARLVRQGLRKRNFSGNFTVVYSPERLPETWVEDQSLQTCGRKPLGSAVTVTAAAGMVLASLVLRDIVCNE
jgi:tRNA A37 threonylcarbamoyladenosine dehydratase